MLRGGDEEAGRRRRRRSGGAAGADRHRRRPGPQPVARTIAATGTLAARRDMPVGVAGEGGMVARVLVQPGQWVGAGQTLAVIDRSVQAQQAAQLAAQVQVARADAALAQQELRARAVAGLHAASFPRPMSTAKHGDARRRQRPGAGRRGRLAEPRAASAGWTSARRPRAWFSSAMSSPARSSVPAPAPCSGSPRAARWNCAPSSAKPILRPFRSARRRSVTPVGPTSSFTGSVWQISPVINAQNRQGVARVALAYNAALRPGGFASVDIVAGIAAGAGAAANRPSSATTRAISSTSSTQGNKVERRAVKTGTVTTTGIAVVAGLSGNETRRASRRRLPQSRAKRSGRSARRS